MSFIGPTSNRPPVPGPVARPLAPASAPSFEATLRSVTAPSSAAPGVRFDRTDAGVPPAPPAEVLDAIGAAADRVEELAKQNRELHFQRDEATGRVVVQVRELATGRLIRTIPPSGALAA